MFMDGKMDLMFQTDDDGRVGNVLMGYASLMVSTQYDHYCIILNGLQFTVLKVVPHAANHH